MRPGIYILMVRTAYKALAAALLKSLNMRVSEAKGGGHGLLASPLDTPLIIVADQVKGAMQQEIRNGSKSVRCHPDFTDGFIFR